MGNDGFLINAGNMFYELPAELLVMIIECAARKDLKTLRCVNWAFCSAIDNIMWKRAFVSVSTADTIWVKNNMFSFEAPHYISPLLTCLERNAPKLKAVGLTIDNSMLYSIEREKVAEIFSVFKLKGVNIKQCHFRLSECNSSVCKLFRSPGMSWNPHCSIDICGPIRIGVTSMVEAIASLTSEDELEITVSEAVPIQSIPFSLWLSYGAAITSLRMTIDSNESIAHFGNLEFCTNLKALHITTGNYEHIPADTKLRIPDSVTTLSLNPLNKKPGLEIIASKLGFFSIDCKTHPSSLALKFSSLEELCIDNCAAASEELLKMLAEMGSWGTLRLDTTDRAVLLRFKSVIENTKDCFDMHYSLKPQPEYRGDNFEQYLDWLRKMAPALDQLPTLTLTLPLFPPEKLKEFILVTARDILFNLEELYLRQQDYKGLGLVNLKRTYPFLTAVRYDYSLWYIGPDGLNKLENEIWGGDI